MEVSKILVGANAKELEMQNYVDKLKEKNIDIFCRLVEALKGKREALKSKKKAKKRLSSVNSLALHRLRNWHKEQAKR